MSNSKTREPSIADMLRTIWSYKKVVAVVFFSCVAAAVGVYLAITPLFEATTSVMLMSAGAEPGKVSEVQQVELVNSQARVAESSGVVRDAINIVGINRFEPIRLSRLDGFGGRLRALLRGSSPVPSVPLSDMDILVAQLNRSITVRTEPNSNVIRIAYTDHNPLLAADFTNALAKAFIERQLALSSRPGEFDFFQAQKRQFDAEAERRARVLEDFEKREAIYSIEDQRNLLLHRTSDLRASLSTARVSIAEKQGQKEALTSQLRLLKPVTLSPFVSNLVKELGSEAHSVGEQSSGRSSGDGNPPLLMVRVYQDAMVDLFKVNSELAGLRDMLAQQEKEILGVNAALFLLAGKDAEYEQLKRDLSVAVYNADLYAKRAISEKIESELLAAKLTNVRVIQEAIVPLRARFPRGTNFLAFGGGAGLILGIGFSLLLDSRRKANGADFAGLLGLAPRNGTVA